MDALYDFKLLDLNVLIDATYSQTVEQARRRHEMGLNAPYTGQHFAQARMQTCSMLTKNCSRSCIRTIMQHHGVRQAVTDEILWTVVAVQSINS